MVFHHQLAQGHKLVIHISATINIVFPGSPLPSPSITRVYKQGFTIFKKSAGTVLHREIRGPRVLSPELLLVHFTPDLALAGVLDLSVSHSAGHSCSGERRVCLVTSR